MLLSKAIEIAQDILHYVKPGDPPDEHDALKLLIEAGKRTEKCRLCGCVICTDKLPDETLEK